MAGGQRSPNARAEERPDFGRGEGRSRWLEGSGWQCRGEVGREDRSAQGAGGSWAPRAGAGLIFPFLE